MALGRGGVSYERGTPVQMAHMQRKDLSRPRVLRAMQRKGVNLIGIGKIKVHVILIGIGNLKKVTAT